MKPKRWYVGRTGNHQGLVIDEDSGASIAAVYDKADAPLIAAAPKLLAACVAMLDAQGARRHPLGDPDEGIATLCAEAAAKARNAIADAEGRS